MATACLRPLLLAATIAAMALLHPAPASAQEATEYSLKAVLFIRLAQFVYWPPDKTPTPPLKLCVVGRNPFGNALSSADQSTQTVEAVIAPPDLGVCQMLFIPRSEQGALNSWLERSSNRSLVTVSDIPGFARAGGMIELPLEGERVALVLNRRAAQNRGIDFNAQFLRLARVVD